MKRKSSTISSLIVAVIFVFGLGACSQRVLDFTIISSKNTSLKIAESAKGSRVSGEDMAAYFIFPLGNPQVKEAVDRAIEKAGPGYDALLDGVIYSHFKVILLFGTFGYSIEGTPIKTSELTAQLERDGIDPKEFFAQHSLLLKSDSPR
jgi:hypothetical protein